MECKIEDKTVNSDAVKGPITTALLSTFRVAGRPVPPPCAGSLNPPPVPPSRQGCYATQAVSVNNNAIPNLARISLGFTGVLL